MYTFPHSIFFELSNENQIKNNNNYQEILNLMVETPWHYGCGSDCGRRG